MPKVEISASKGVVQSSGEGMHIIGGTLADSVGIHTLQELVTIPASGLANVGGIDDNKGTGIGLSKKLPVNSQILNTSMTLIQAATAGATCKLELKTDTQIEAYNAAVGGVDLLSAVLPVGTAGVVGTTVAGGLKTVTTNNVINITHAANDTNVTAGDVKVLVTIVYAGKGEPVAVA